MDSKKLIYVNGHFYDRESKIRIKLKDDIDVILNSDTRNFLDTDQVGKHQVVKTTNEQEQTIVKDPHVKKCKKVFDRGQMLYFRISHQSSVFKKKMPHEFQVELLEDLYFYTKATSKKNEGKLYDCACVVRQNTNGTIKMFEEVLGGSLNEVFKNTFVHYFGLDGNPACNAINRFYEQSLKEDESRIKRYRKIEDNECIKIKKIKVDTL